MTWLEDGTVPWTGPLVIWMHGVWGVDMPHHIPLVAAYGSPTIVPQITVAAKENLTVANANPNVNPLGTIAQVSSPEIRYWVNVSEYTQSSTNPTTTYRWIPLVPKTNHGAINVYSGGTYPGVPAGGINATKYKIAVRSYEINYVAEYFGYYDAAANYRWPLPKLEPTKYYSLCWEQNQLHALEYDTVFFIEPGGYREYDEIPDRTELNSRVAGEKALYEDEFLTAGQIEGSENVTLRWRNLDGSLTGYTTDPTKGGNLVIEATGGGGNSAVEGRTFGPFHTDPPATIYYDETTATIRFQNEPLWYTDAMVLIPDTKLPIEFDVVGDPVINPTTSVIRARAINNNLHCSVTQLNTVNYYPMALANDPVLTDWTVNHIRFVDTQNVTWDVKGDVMPTLMPDDSTAVRQGIIVKPVLNGLYANWNVKSGRPEAYSNLKNQSQYDIPQLNVDYTVDSLDTVEFFGRNGVICTLEGLFANQMRLMIDRKLFIKHDVFGPDLPGDTTDIIFESALGRNAAAIGGDISLPTAMNKWIQWSNFPYNYNSATGDVYQSIAPLPLPFTVNGGRPNERIVQGWYPRNSARWASQWEKDYSAITPENFRTLSTVPPQRSLVVGFWGWGQIGPNNTLVPAPGSNHNIICGESLNFNLRTFGQRYATWNGPYGAQGGNDEQPIGLDIGYQEGLYHVDATVQGIMGLTTTAPFNPVISQAVHLHLVTGNYGSSSDAVGALNARVLQSLDIYQNYDFVPTANQSGYLQAINSRPFSLQGGGTFWLRGGEQVFALLTYNPGAGEDRFFYQVCYVKMSCVKVANVGDIHVGFEAVDADANPTMYKYAPQRWHDMIFY